MWGTGSTTPWKRFHKYRATAARSTSGMRFHERSSRIET